MTDVQIFRAGARRLGFEINGHTGFAPSGEDIVCAAISAISQTALIGLTDVLKLEPDVKIDDDHALLRVMLPDDAPESAQIILLTMEEGLTSIYQQYPDFVRIMFRERR
ncbi:ribosomal-processing cysteine protease Prp [Eubacteriales bacterium OttesenSCG-928-N13]|nr:ribosomal-processing cysteine protease Prp [Eubacteriales bacterium OttesenSCG-928-N13]